jgi:hypothetical protein
MNNALTKCILAILQRGITEARSLVLCGETKKAALLLDALDNLPRHLAEWNDESESQIATQLKCFRDAVPDHPTDFARMLESLS